MSYIKLFRDISKNDVKEVGGKGASLGEMTRANIPVPPGFVITTHVQEKYNKSIPPKIEKEILEAFDDLETQRVAVRSSAIAEDSSSASWAGQLESYLNITREKLINSVRECWNSIQSERALSYAADQNLSKDKLLVAVVVQKMVDSEISGVLFTVNPITKNKNEMMIESGFGLGEMIVQGMITPDNFVVDKNSFEIKNNTLNTQETMLVFQDGQSKEVPVPKNKRFKPSLSEIQIKELTNLGMKIEKHYGLPQDIEWAIDENNKIWIIQSRPITTL